MIFDSPEEKNFIQEAVRKYPCNYEQALQLANTFGQSIQDGQIIDIKAQLKAFPPAPKAQGGSTLPPAGANPGNKDAKVPAGANGNRKTRRARKATTPQE
jgi:hypothetical protein